MNQLSSLLGILLLTVCQAAISLETDFQVKFLNTPLVYNGPGNQSTEPGKLVSLLTVDGLAAHIAEAGSGDTLISIQTEIGQGSNTSNLFNDSFHFDLLGESFSIGKAKNGKLTINFDPDSDVLKIRFVQTGLISGSGYRAYQAIEFGSTFSSSIEFHGSVGSEMVLEEEEEEEEEEGPSV